MSGLNIITDAILDKARAEADEIIKAAEQKKAEIIEEAKVEASNKCKIISDEADLKIKNIEANAKSSSEQQLSRDLLKRKAVFIGEVANEAKEKVYSMTDEEYNEILMSLLKKFAKSEKAGEIAFCKKDKERISEALNTEIKNFNLEISAEDAKIKGGFILKYGRVEENCSIEAIFHDKQEDITDFLNKELFS